MSSRKSSCSLLLASLACLLCVASAVHYDLSHLTEPDDQWVVGPVQDDEALLLYSVVRGMRLQTILEVGGKSGYSAKNFIRAIDHTKSPEAKVFTVDIMPVPRQGERHVVLQKNASLLTATDLENKQLDLVFFDCHDIGAQIDLHQKLQKMGLLTDDTVVAVHDTNLYYYPQPDGTVVSRAHQAVERDMVNWLKGMGYDVFSIKTSPRRHSDRFPRRHGLSILQKFETMVNPPDPSAEAREKETSWSGVDMARAERDVAGMLRALAKPAPRAAVGASAVACAPAAASGALGGSWRGTQGMHVARMAALGLAVTGPFWAQPLTK